jgi:hypothetical protein
MSANESLGFLGAAAALSLKSFGAALVFFGIAGLLLRHSRQPADADSLNRRFPRNGPAWHPQAPEGCDGAYGS